MARSFRTVAVLSLFSIVLPTGCDSPTSSVEVEPSAAITPDGRVLTTVRQQVALDGWEVAGECALGPLSTNGGLTVTHRLAATPTFGGKTFLVELSTIVLPSGVSLVGESGTELFGVGVDKVELAQEVTLPHTLELTNVIVVQGHGPPDGPGELGPPISGTLSLTGAVHIAEDFGISTTVESVEIDCPPSGSTTGGGIFNVFQDEITLDTKVTTACFDDGMLQEIAVRGVIGLLVQLKLKPVEGKDTFLMDLVTHVWSEGVQIEGESGLLARVVGADKVQLTQEVMLPHEVESASTTPIVDRFDPLETEQPDQDTQLTNRLAVGIAEDFGITTTLEGIEIACPPMTDN